jgi:hypothetical protein
LQAEAGSLGADAQRIELSDRAFEGKGRVHAVGTSVEPSSFTWPDVVERGQPLLIAA